MTETLAPEVLTEVLTLVDRGLADVQHRSLVPSNEVSDLLLDVRLLLSGPPATVAELVDVAPTPVGAS